MAELICLSCRHLPFFFNGCLNLINRAEAQQGMSSIHGDILGHFEKTPRQQKKITPISSSFFSKGRPNSKCHQTKTKPEKSNFANFAKNEFTRWRTKRKRCKQLAKHLHVRYAQSLLDRNRREAEEVFVQEREREKGEQVGQGDYGEKIKLKKKFSAKNPLMTSHTLYAEVRPHQKKLLSFYPHFFSKGRPNSKWKATKNKPEKPNFVNFAKSAFRPRKSVPPSTT